MKIKDKLNMNQEQLTENGPITLNKTPDTTMLLENRINHPPREMHQLFADKLFSLLIDEKSVFNNNFDTMWNRDKERACNGTERY